MWCKFMFLTTSAPVFYRFCSTGARPCARRAGRTRRRPAFWRPARNFGQMALTLPQKVCYNMARGAAPHHVRGWRNRQTRTFEGRVVIPCEFKSRPSHHVGMDYAPFKKPSRLAGLFSYRSVIPPFPHKTLLCKLSWGPRPTGQGGEQASISSRKRNSLQAACCLQ